MGLKYIERGQSFRTLEYVIMSYFNEPLGVNLDPDPLIIDTLIDM
jgi:hypothetical protein